MKSPGEILLISCYELGRQPLGLAFPLGALREAGYRPAAIDLAVEPLDEECVRRARFVGISVPMHTATRIGAAAARRVRDINPRAHLCFYGLYATLNTASLAGLADAILGPDSASALVELVRRIEDEGEPVAAGPPASSVASHRPGRVLPAGPLDSPLRSLDRSAPASDFTGPDTAGSAGIQRGAIPRPSRDGLPPLARYARLERDGTAFLAGSVEATRGCLHLCRHCPIPPVYEGRFFVVPKKIVLDDIAFLVDAGARHITFADADFLNGPGHVMPIVRAMHERFQNLTFDVTAKIEHLLKHRRLLPELANLGCLFIVSAVESVSDEVLFRLRKGHTRADVDKALAVCAEAGISLRPSLLPFTPWSDLEDLSDLLEFVETRDLIETVDPVYWSIRLLLPPGSLLLDDDIVSSVLGPLDPEGFSYRWSHPDPRVDALQRQIARLVEAAEGRGDDPAATFERVRRMLHWTHAGEGATAERALAEPASADGVIKEPRFPAGAGVPAGSIAGANAVAGPNGEYLPFRLRSPRLTESWFC